MERRDRAHHQRALILPRSTASNRFDRLQALAADEVRSVPEATDPIDVLRREVHVRGQHVGESPRLAAAHRVGLAVSEKGRHRASRSARLRGGS